MLQEIRVVSLEDHGVAAHATARRRERQDAWGARDTTRHGLRMVATTLLLSLFALPAQAQGPSGLQVAARVVPTGPSREALSAALRPELGAAAPLAEIHHELQSGVTDSLGVARRPRAIVTIAFLRN